METSVIDNLALYFIHRRVTQELLEIMLAEDNSSGEESESGSDSSDDDDLELLLLQNVFTPRELSAHVNYQDIGEDDFQSLFRCTLS